MKQIYILATLLISSVILSAQTPDSWTQKSNFPGTARATAFAFTIGNKGYVGGGLNFSTGTFSDFREYDPATDTWTSKANFGGGGRSAAVTFTIGNKGYVLTGSNGSAKQNDIWEYDPVADTWTQKTPLPAATRNYAVAFSIGSKGYLATGFADSTAFIAFNDFWQFDPVANSWTQKQSVPGPTRSSAIGFGIGGKGYVGTGDTCNYNNCFILNDFYEYDTLTNAWTPKASVGAFRDEAVAFTINGKGYVCTGEVNSAATNDLLEYDPVADTWTTRASKPGSGKTCACAFSVGNRGYVTTGYDGGFNFTDDVYEYTPDSSVVIVTSVNENLNTKNILLTPNPASDKVSIIFPNKNSRSVTATVRNITGEILLEQKENNFADDRITFDISHFTSGVYFLDMNINQTRVSKLLLKE